MCVAEEQESGNQILSKMHSTPYSVHLGATKMYRDLKECFWWVGMKKDVVDYVAKCLTCQKIMAKQQRPGGELTINRGT